MRLLKENPVYTREEIAQKVSKTARAVQRALNRLKEDGKIVRIGNKGKLIDNKKRILLELINNPRISYDTLNV